jgi:hypothetical protein
MSPLNREHTDRHLGGLWRAAESNRKIEVRLEAELEEWIANDPQLLMETLVIVGRQLKVEAGFIDLLAMDGLGRWVVIELKRAKLYRDTVSQALDYASCIESIDSDELRGKLFGNLPNEVQADVDRALEAEAADRDVAVVVGGVGIDPSLTRVVDYLANHDLVVSVVSFDVYEAADGRQLLIREVLEEARTQVQRERKSTNVSVEDLMATADKLGSGTEFRQIMQLTEGAGLYNRAYKNGVMVAPPHNRGRYLMYVRPESGGVHVTHGAEQFVEFFPELDAQEIDLELGASRLAYKIELGDPDDWLTNLGRVLADVRATLEGDE